VSAAALAERLGRPRARRLALAALTLLALLLRFHAVYRRQLTAPNSPARLRGDERGYDALARELLAGEPLSWPGRTPGYPAWLAALHRLGGHSYDFIAYAQTLAGAAVVPLTYVLARRLFGVPAALGAAALAAVSHPLVYQATLLQSEVLFTPLVLLVVFALDSALAAADAGRPATGRVAWAGALVGLADMVRPTLILFPAFAALVLVARLGVRRGARYAAVYAAAVALVVAPWTARNWQRYHVLLPLATSNAILWQGSPEYYHLTHDRGYRYLDVWEKVLYGHDDDAPDPGDVAGERYWRDRAVRSIRAEPLTYLRYAAEKARRTGWAITTRTGATRTRSTTASCGAPEWDGSRRSRCSPRACSSCRRSSRRGCSAAAGAPCCPCTRCSCTARCCTRPRTPRRG
jgi:hypothetical protein